MITEQTGSFYCKGLGEIKFVLEHVIVSRGKNNKPHTQGYISFEECDPRIEISYNTLRYLSLYIDSICRYYKKSDIVRIGNCEVIKDQAPKNLKLYKVKMRIR